MILSALLALSSTAQEAPVSAPNPEPKFGAFVEQIESKSHSSYVSYDSAGRPVAATASTHCSQPSSIVFAPNGDAYLSSTRDDSIYRIRPGPPTQVSTFGKRGLMPGELCRPSGLTFDPRVEGRVIVADTLNHRVSVFDREGRPLANFGKLGSGEAELNHPYDVAVDAHGAVFVADTGNDRIVKLDADGKFVKSFGGRGSYPGLFRYPTGLDVHGERVYVADRDNHRIQVFDLAGEYIYEWGVHALLPREGNGKLHDPSDVAISPDGTRAAVIEPMEDRIQVFGIAREDTVLVSPERDSAVHYGGFPSARGDLFAVADPTGPSVSIFDMTRGTPIEITRFGRPGNGPGHMLRPISVLFDEKAEVVYVADPFAYTISAWRIARKPDEILKFDPYLARLERSVDLTQPSAVSLRWPIEPAGMSLCEQGEILVADRVNRRVVVLGPDLVPKAELATNLAVAPLGITCRSPQLILVTSDESDFGTTGGQQEGSVRCVNRPFAFGIVQVRGDDYWTVDPTTSLLSFFLSTQELGGRRVTGSRGLGSGQFWKPEGITVDAKGRLFVIDTGNHRFQILDAQGQYLDMFGARFYTEAARNPPSPTPEPKAWDGAKNVRTLVGSWRVAWRTKPVGIPRGENFMIDAWVFAPGAPGTPVKDVVLEVDAWMPEHLHGMNRVPRVTRRDDNGFTFEGVYFHMPGFWELSFDVTEKGVTERATVRVDLE